jgi:hypothetical protein
MNIQPQPKSDDQPERWNWDSPLLISPHNKNRLYFGSQRLWRSDNQGDAWTPISEDLTTNANRYELKMIDRLWSVDALYDTGAMSKYATLTSISESPLVEGLLYTGSDDGLVHISEDGGQNWRKSEVLPKVPERSFINDIEASQHDENTVFVTADAHKFGDFKPYLFISENRGRSWRSITGDLPSSNIIWVVKQDYVNENLLFIGTEYGIYFSTNKGINWIKLESGVPTIPFRDIELHQRDTDLVGASFGRGFYVLDDYSPLREISSVVDQKSNTLFPVRDAWWYMPSVPMQAKGMPGQGSTSFRTENPEFGAVFTYYLNKVPLTSKEAREKSEESLKDKNMSIPFPGWDRLEKETTENEAQVMLLVSTENDEPVRWIKGTSKKGLHRANWDLRLPPPDPITLEQPDFKPPWVGDAQGPLAAPGKYNVELFIVHDGNLKSQGKPQTFTVKPVKTSGTDFDYKEVASFQKKTSELARQLGATSRKLQEANERITYMKAALLETPSANQNLFLQLNELEVSLAKLRKRLNGNPVRQKLNESAVPSIASLVGDVVNAHWETTQPPTTTQKRDLNTAEIDFKNLSLDLGTYLEALETYETGLEKAGAPYTKGRKL